MLRSSLMAAEHQLRFTFIQACTRRVRRSLIDRPPQHLGQCRLGEEAGTQSRAISADSTSLGRVSQSARSTPRGSVAAQTTLSGGVMMGLGLDTDGPYALVAVSAGSWLKRNHGYLRPPRSVFASIDCALGMRAALAESRSDTQQLGCVRLRQSA